MKKDFILLEFNEKQNASHYNTILNVETLTFDDSPNTNDWEPICIFNYSSRKERKIINDAVKLIKKKKENKIRCGKEYIDSNITEFSKDSVYLDNIIMRKIKKG